MSSFEYSMNARCSQDKHSRHSHDVAFPLSHRKSQLVAVCFSKRKWNQIHIEVGGLALPDERKEHKQQTSTEKLNGEGVAERMRAASRGLQTGPFS